MTTARFGNLILDQGFIMVPNLLLDYQEDLGLSDDELLFIIKVLRHHETFRIHDKDLSQSVSEKTLQRRRASLKNKGYLDTTVFKSQDANGTWITNGITYDFTKLLLAISEIYNSKNKVEAKEEPRKIPKQIKQSHSKEVNEFITEFESKYNYKYKLTQEEELLLKNASPEFIRSIPYILKYVNDKGEAGDLPEGFTPKLIFFLKVDFRKEELIKYASELIEEKEEEEKEKVRRVILAEETIKEKAEFETFLRETGFVYDEVVEYLRKNKAPHILYFVNKSFNADHLKNIKPYLEKMKDNSKADYNDIT